MSLKGLGLPAPVPMLSGMPVTPPHALSIWGLRQHRSGHPRWPHGSMVQSQDSAVCLLLAPGARTYWLCDLAGMLVCPT